MLAPGDGSDPVQFIDARDLAEWTIRMAEQRTIGVFNATGPAHQLTMSEMLDGVARGGQRHAQLTWVSDKLPGRQQGLGLERHAGLGAGRGRHRRLPSPQHRPRPRRRPHLPAAGGDRRDTLAWFKTQPADRQAKLRAGLAPDREAALLAKWKAEKA